MSLVADPRSPQAEILSGYMEAITERAIRDLGHTQPWQKQFHRRYLEMRSLCRLHDLSQARRTLELGCGNAFGSALLSQGRERVVATDLDQQSLQTHSIGLQKARDLLNGLGLDWCEVQGASGMDLPFDDRSFDLIFSLFVLEHVPDRDKCLQEMHRVLTPDGLAIHAVPGMMWAASAPFRFYLYLLQRILVRLTGRSADKEFGPDGEPVETPTDAPPQGMWSLFRSRYPQFPIPPPHGEYRTYFEELRSYRRRRWIELFERNGFEVLECRPIMMLPLSVMHLTLGDRGQALYERCLPFDQWLADRKLLRGYGELFGLVARKRER